MELEEDEIWWSPRSSKPLAVIYHGGRFDSCSFRIVIRASMDNINTLLRSIPQVERLLQEGEVAAFVPVLGRGMVVRIVRKVLDAYRDKVSRGQDIQVDRIVPSIVMNCLLKKKHKLQRVINGTGVLIHTNLGRAPLPEGILSELAKAMSGYCNIEYHIPSEKRGRRGGFAEELAASMAGAEDALVVNNNAAAVFLVLAEFARGREVIVSRGELIQIGGGFRIPDILAESGARLVEIGTTNVTTLDDYRAAIGDDTAMIFSAHWSNFAMSGFTASPTLRELASLLRPGMLLMRDLGSGTLADDDRLAVYPDASVRHELEQGADLVCFSADKLLGACQAGIIVGRKDLVARLRKNQFMRVIRADKLSYYALQESLILHDSGRLDDVPLWNMRFADAKDISSRVRRYLGHVKHHGAKEWLRRAPMEGTFGGGSLPGQSFESMGVIVSVPGASAASLYSAFLDGEVPVIGTIADGEFRIDFRTVFDRDVATLALVTDRILASMDRNA